MLIFVHQDFLDIPNGVIYSFQKEKILRLIKVYRCRFLCADETCFYLQPGKENDMLKIIGVVINLGIIAYLGYHASSCMEPEQIAGLNINQDPMIYSFVAVVALFIALRN